MNTPYWICPVCSYEGMPVSGMVVESAELKMNGGSFYLDTNRVAHYTCPGCSVSFSNMVYFDLREVTKRRLGVTDGGK